MNDKSSNLPKDDGNTNDENGNTNDEYGNTLEDNKISIENESPKESHITIIYINAVKQMNMAQLNIEPDTGEKAIEEDHEWMTVSRIGTTLDQDGTIDTPCCKMVNNQLWQYPSHTHT